MRTWTWTAFRLAKKKATGEFVMQRQTITRTYKKTVWWKPWEEISETTYGEWEDIPTPEV